MNPSQMIQIDRLRLGSFNDMDGDLVADSLIKNEKLWKSFLFGRFGNYGCNLIELRDLADDHINASTLLILTDKSNWPELEKVIETWKADEVGYITADDEIQQPAPYRTAAEVGTEMGGGFWVEGGKIPMLVRVWWD